MNLTKKTPVALTIAGSDSSGGAGIQADLKTFSALGVYGASVITALTAQNTQGVTAIHVPPADFVRRQIEAVLSDLSVAAIKIGMLAQAPVIKEVAAALGKFEGSIILDPVMVATSGDPLLQQDAVLALREDLFPFADLITPNLPEAAALLNSTIPENEEQMLDILNALTRLGAKAVLLKGGHSEGKLAVDYYLAPGADPVSFRAERVDTGNTHGTGCTLSSAICAYIVRGYPMQEAIGLAKTYLTGALQKADGLTLGKGSGPVHHFHDIWLEN